MLIGAALIVQSFLRLCSPVSTPLGLSAKPSRNVNWVAVLRFQSTRPCVACVFITSWTDPSINATPAINERRPPPQWPTSSRILHSQRRLHQLRQQVTITRLMRRDSTRWAAADIGLLSTSAHSIESTCRISSQFLVIAKTRVASLGEISQIGLLFKTSCTGQNGLWQISNDLLPPYTDRFPTYAVQAAVLCGYTNIFVAAEVCGCFAEGRWRFKFWMRSIRFLHGLRRIFAVFYGSLRL